MPLFEKKSVKQEALLSEYVKTDDGDLVLKLRNKKHKKTMEDFLEALGDDFYFEEHRKEPFTVKYDESTTSFIITPGDVSRGEIVKILKDNDLLQAPKAKSGPSVP
jgi:hypothetical protein